MWEALSSMYSFVSVGNSSVFANNIGACFKSSVLLVPTSFNEAAKGAAANPSTNDVPFTNTILLFSILSVPLDLSAIFNSAPFAFATFTAVSYLFWPATIPTLNSPDFIKLNSDFNSALFVDVTLTVL